MSGPGKYSMSIPKRCQMPDLSGLSPRLLEYAVKTAVAGGAPADPVARRLCMNFIRLTDLTIHEYESARTNLSKVVESEGVAEQYDRLYWYFRLCDHLELCVISLKRAINAMCRVSACKEAPDIDRTSRRFLDAHESNIRNIRDTVTHIEEDIATGKITTGHSHALRAAQDGDRARIGEYEIKFSDLSSVIRKLHAIASTVLSPAILRSQQDGVNRQ